MITASSAPIAAFRNCGTYIQQAVDLDYPAQGGDGGLVVPWGGMEGVHLVRIDDVGHEAGLVAGSGFIYFMPPDGISSNTLSDVLASSS